MHVSMWYVNIYIIHYTVYTYTQGELMIFFFRKWVLCGKIYKTLYWTIATPWLPNMPFQALLFKKYWHYGDTLVLCVWKPWRHLYDSMNYEDSFLLCLWNLDDNFRTLQGTLSICVKNFDDTFRTRFRDKTQGVI